MTVYNELPEHRTYRDDGCELAPHCLACPLYACRYDLPPKRAGAYLRWLEIEPLLAAGVAAADAGARLARPISKRSVFRLQRQARNGVFTVDGAA